MKIDQTILSVLAAATADGGRLFLAGQLDRATYAKANKVIEAAGGKWNGKIKAHLFPMDAADAIESILLTGEVSLNRSPQQDLGWFPTPPAVVRRLIELADLAPGMHVLEPSAGRGAIAHALSNPFRVTVHAVELLRENYEHLRVDCAWYGDFLAMSPKDLPAYDRIVMNPPFGKQADIHHVRHALDFRDLVRARGGEIEALPDGAFKASGTDVRTVTVTIPGARACH